MPVVWLGMGQTFCDGVGVGVHRAAIEKCVINRHDHQQLDDDGQRDFFGERVLQEVRQDSA